MASLLPVQTLWVSSSCVVGGRGRSARPSSAFRRQRRFVRRRDGVKMRVDDGEQKLDVARYNNEKEEEEGARAHADDELEQRLKSVGLVEAPDGGYGWIVLITGKSHLCLAVSH